MGLEADLEAGGETEEVAGLEAALEVEAGKMV